ncbi:MAG: MFS transporter, partial [Planctomycetaceae bacterium]
LTKVVSFPLTFFFGAGCILAVTVFIALPLREGVASSPKRHLADPMTRIRRKIVIYLHRASRSFFLNRAAFLGLIYSLLPAGSYALGLHLQTTLAVELGLNNDQVATLNLISAIVFAVSCVCGGSVSDRWGRRRMLALYTAATAIPAAWLGLLMLQHGWVMPVDPNLVDRPVPAAALITAFWAATISYNVANGLMYGTRMALFMDITAPAVAATQFTAYMAMQNLVISYTATWQGQSIVRWGYPTTLFLAAAVGLAGLVLLPFMRPRKQ